MPRGILVRRERLNVRFPAANATQQAILNVGNPTMLDAGDAWSAATGVNYKLNDRWQVRSGLWYEPEIIRSPPSVRHLWI